MATINIFKLMAFFWVGLAQTTEITFGLHIRNNKNKIHDISKKQCEAKGNTTVVFFSDHTVLYGNAYFILILHYRPIINDGMIGLL